MCVGDLMWRAGSGFHGHIVMVVAGKARASSISKEKIAEILVSGVNNLTDMTTGETSTGGEYMDLSALTETLISSQNFTWIMIIKKKKYHMIFQIDWQVYLQVLLLLLVN